MNDPQCTKNIFNNKSSGRQAAGEVDFRPPLGGVMVTGLTVTVY